MDVDPTGLTAREIARGINEDRWSAEAVTRAFLERWNTVEDGVAAWAVLDPDRAIDQARTCDRRDQKLPLRGVPVGIKDIFATTDFATEYGSPIYRGNRERADAACVALARADGAVVFGKTTTTEFAANNPAYTRNPCDLTRSPGGSSSGSAAAVAAGMIPLANGTQTAGSIIRPASYCGVVGYKPSFGYTPRAGLKPSAESLDTVGFFAQDVGDAALFAAVSSGRSQNRQQPKSGNAPRFALCRAAEWNAADSETQKRVEAFAQDLSVAGATVSEIMLPAEFDGLAQAQWTVMVSEIAQSLAWERLNHRDRCSPNLQSIFDLAETLSEDSYTAAFALGRRCRARLAQMFLDAGVDAFIAPSVTGEAPAGLEKTGDPILNRIWTFLHVPCVSLPVMSGPAGLPLGLQVIGPRDADKTVLDACRWIEQRFPYRRSLDPELVAKLSPGGSNSLGAESSD